MEPAEGERRLTPRPGTTALVGQLERLVDQALGLVEFEPHDVRLRQRLRRDGLEVLTAGCQRDREALLDIRHRLRHRSPRTPIGTADHQRVEVGVDVRLGLLQLERAVDELLRARGVSGLSQHSIAERRQRQRLHQGVALGLRLRPNLLHLEGDGRQVAQSPYGASGVVATSKRGLELDCAQELPARRLVLLARQGSLPAARQRLSRRTGQVGGGSAVELGEERRSLVEMVRTDLQQLLAGALLDPLREPRVLLGA